MYRKYVFSVFPVLIFTLMLYIFSSPVYAGCDVPESQVPEGNARNVVSLVQSGSYENGILIDNSNIDLLPGIVSDIFSRDIPFYSLISQKDDVNICDGAFDVIDTYECSILFKDSNNQWCIRLMDNNFSSGHFYPVFGGAVTTYYNPQYETFHMIYYDGDTRDFYLTNDTTHITFYSVTDYGFDKYDDCFVRYFQLPDGESSLHSTSDEVSEIYDLNPLFSSSVGSLGSIPDSEFYFKTNVNINDVVFSEEAPFSPSDGDVYVSVKDGVIDSVSQYDSDTNTWISIEGAISHNDSWVPLKGFSVPSEAITPVSPAPDNPDPDNPENPVSGNMNGMMEILNLLLTFSISILSTIASNPILLFVLAGYLVCICIYILDQIKRAIRDN